jgi:hypothetical protein
MPSHSGGFKENTAAMTELQIDKFDPRKRRLCPDGSCIGVIGADGRCKVCGTEDAQAPRGLGPEAMAGGCAAEDEEEMDLGAREEAEPAPRASGGEPGGAFDPKRKLCSDGACVGVIGSNGRCKVCGTPAGG